MTHMHMGFKVNHQRNMTLECLPAKISTHINAHLITLSDERSGTMLLKSLKKSFVENIGQSGPVIASHAGAGVPPHKRLLNRRQHSFPMLSQSHCTFQILER